MTVEKVLLTAKHGAMFSPLVPDEESSVMSIPSTTIDLDSEDEAALNAAKPLRPIKKCTRAYDLIGGEAPLSTNLTAQASADNSTTNPGSMSSLVAKAEKTADLERTKAVQEGSLE